MMIGDHEIEHSAHGVDFRRTGDTAVHGYDEPRAVIREFLQRFPMQAVALLPIRDIEVHDGAKATKRTHQKRRRCDTVHVVIAVYDDFFRRLYRPPYPRYRTIHILHQERIIIRLKALGIQKSFRFLLVGDIPPTQDSREERRNAEPFGKRLIRRVCPSYNSPFLPQRELPHNRKGTRELSRVPFRFTFLYFTRAFFASCQLRSVTQSGLAMKIDE